MIHPKVSICIPTYNNLLGIQKCLESVFIQTFTDYEIIITDDSRNDDVKNYIFSLNRKDIQYHKNTIALGSPQNWNAAIEKANGEYIKILHHDDWFTDKNALEVFVKLLNDNPKGSLGFVSSKVINLENDTLEYTNKPDGNYVERINQFPMELLRGNKIGAPSATIFRKASNLFFDPQLIWLVDIDFYINILKQGTLHFDSREVISIGISPSQITNSVNNDKKINVFEYFYLLKKYKIQNLAETTILPPYRWLAEKFSLKNIRDIRDAGYTEELPADVDIIFQSISKKNSLKKMIKNLIYTQKKK